MGSLSTQERADRLIDKVFHKTAPIVQQEPGQPATQPKSAILRSLNRSRRRLDDMKRGL